MSSANTKIVIVKIIGFGTFTGAMIRTQAPTSVQNFNNTLPIKGRGFVQNNRLIVSSELKLRAEGSQVSFVKGDISIDPSSGNIAIHLEDNTLEHPENHLGNIIESLGDTSSVKSTAVIFSMKQ